MRNESEVYRRIGVSPYIPKFIGWDAEDCSLVLEHLEKGELDSYVRNVVGMGTPFLLTLDDVGRSKRPQALLFFTQSTRFTAILRRVTLC